jgi:hypothetical protein
MTMARPQFTLRALLVAMLVVALGAGVISWLPPQTRFDLAMFAQVFAVLFGMLFTGVLAVAVALYCLKLCRRAIGRLK